MSPITASGPSLLAPGCQISALATDRVRFRPEADMPLFNIRPRHQKRTHDANRQFFADKVRLKPCKNMDARRRKRGQSALNEFSQLVVSGISPPKSRVGIGVDFARVKRKFPPTPQVPFLDSKRERLRVNRSEAVGIAVLVGHVIPRACEVMGAALIVGYPGSRAVVVVPLWKRRR